MADVQGPMTNHKESGRAWPLVSLALGLWPLALPSSLKLDHLDQPADDRVGIDAVGPGVEVEHEAVPEHGAGEALHVVEIDVVLAREDGACLGAEDEVLR